MRMLFFIGISIFCIMLMNTGFSFSEEIRYQSGDRRDPFIPVSRVAVIGNAEVDLAVQGVVYDPSGRSFVVINGESYRQGDTVGDKTIVAIYQSKIIVSIKGVENEYWISSAEKEISEAKKKKDA